MAKKPNIVFVLADQLRYASCGYAGDSLAQTPHLDRLAGEGVNFQQAVTSMPVCAAYRASLFTGKYVTSTGMVINEIRLNPDHHPRCLAHCLADGGYELGYIGKWHLWANQLGHHDDPANSYTPPGPYRLGFDGHWAAYNFHHDYYAPGAYYHTDSPEKIPYPDGSYEPDAQTDMAIDYIRDLAKNADDDAPFALMLMVGTPHDPWTPENVPPEYYARFAETEFPLPPNWQQENDTPYGDEWSNLPKSPEKRTEWMRAYYAMTANLDDNVGRLRAAIDEMGLTDDTLFVFTSDHGECFGAHGRMKKNTFYEEAARVPLLMHWPNGGVTGRASDACITNVDLMPTLLGLAGEPIPAEVEGCDLSEVAAGADGPQPPFAFLQNTGACAAWEDGHEWRAVRTKQYTYAMYKVDGSELLFDNLADPYQLQNLAADPAMQAVCDYLSEQMEAKMASLNDTFELSSYYKEHWVDNNRCIIRTATSEARD